VSSSESTFALLSINSANVRICPHPTPNRHCERSAAISIPHRALTVIARSKATKQSKKHPRHAELDSASQGRSPSSSTYYRHCENGEAVCGNLYSTFCPRHSVLDTESQGHCTIATAPFHRYLRSIKRAFPL